MGKIMHGGIEYSGGGAGGGGGGSTVTITPTLSTGTKIADFTIDGVSGELYAPQGGGGGAGYTETLLWGNMPFSYPATQQADATLSADIKDFDRIVVYGGWTSSNIQCFCEQSFNASVLDSLSAATSDTSKQFVMQMNAGGNQFIRISKGSADNIIHFRYNGVVGIYAIVGIKF